MMPDQREILAALYGALRLMRLDQGGMNWFNLSTEGFWRSFFAAVLVAPFFALLMYLDLSLQAETIDHGRAAVVAVVYYVLGWALVPVVLIGVTKVLNLDAGYVPLVVAYNWTVLPQVLLLTPVTVIDATGLISGGLSMFLVMTIKLYILVVDWFVVRTALQTATSTAIGIVLLFETLGIILFFTVFSFI